jgi:hypothetical protein
MPTKKRCGFKVKWQRNKWGYEDAVLYDSRGHSINAINFPGGFPTAKEKKRAERVLLKPHCKRV